MSTTMALVPLKAFGTAKSRLAAWLTPAERASLARCMAARVLAVLQAEPHLAAVAVISADEEVRCWARLQGAIALSEDGKGLNAALASGARSLAALGATAMLVVPGDVPFLGRQDLRQLLALAQARQLEVVAVPAARDVGTNALLVTLPLALPLAFGLPQSAHHHVRQSRQQGQSAALLALASLAVDVDLPRDLRLYLRRMAAPLPRCS